ncbi:MAG: hypothetical protein ACK4U0_05015 [Mesorhizobium sp.]
MFDARHLRPVSGEIMTDRCVRSSGVPSTDDIEDAEFEVLHLSTVIPSNADRLGPRTRRNDARPRAGMDMLKSTAGNGAGATRERAGPLFWVVGVVMALASFWISGGHTLSGPLLALMSPAADDSMRIAQLTSGVEERNGRRLLVIDGSIVNTARATGLMPTLAIEVTGDAGRVTRYRLDSAGALIEPGEHYRFSSRVDAPMGSVAGVSVTMTKRND